MTLVLKRLENIRNNYMILNFYTNFKKTKNRETNRQDIVFIVDLKGFMYCISVIYVQHVNRI